jgi:uncharacterized damage-inducible protein DinB
MTDRTTQLRALRDLPGRLRNALAGLDDSQLDTPYREGGWTIRQVVHHLADSHAHAYLRMKMIVNEDHPTIKPYNQNVWATNQDALHGPVAGSLDLLEGLHRRWADFLEQLPEDAWSRSAVHPERGEVTMTGMLATYAGHGEKHIGHIMGLRKARGWE